MVAVGYSKYLRSNRLIRSCGILHPSSAMANIFWSMILIAGCAQAQVAALAAPGENAPPKAAFVDSLTSPRVLRGKVGLVRGLVKRVDPVRDQLVIRVFGGGDVRIGFDPQTPFVSGNARVLLSSIRIGSVVSVDTVNDQGKLFARSVRTDPSSTNAVEFNGQIVRYDAAKSELSLSDPISPEGVSLRVSGATTVVSKGQAATLEALTPGALVRVQFSPIQKAANSIEILAEPGSSFTFQGQVMAVDLRSGLLAISNDSDQSVRELAIDPLDGNTLRQLREGVEVSINAEFDGQRYKVRTLTVMPQHSQSNQ